MALTKDAEARIRDHFDLIGADNLHDVDQDMISVLAALNRVREVLHKRVMFHENADHKSMSDHEALRVVKEVRRALEGEA